MTAVTKYKLQEGLLIITFFFTVFVVNILLSDIKDLPILRGLIGAVFLGSVTAFYEIIISVKLQKKLNTILFILFNILFYYFVFSLMLIAYGYINLIFKEGYTLQEAFSHNMLDIFPENFSIMMFYFFVFLFLLQLIRQIRVTAIKGIGKEYLKGRIRQSIEDKRIFLFMDLYSSTTYAEKLGHRLYSNFIKDIYNELDEYILATKGSLYQFVGDQVVVVWSMKEGIEQNNAIRFFFLVEEALRKKEHYFLSRYGIMPEFKAGVHCGEVSITEVGNVLKREIAYHGDPVNTTARICEKCRDVNEKFLVSNDLKEELLQNNVDFLVTIGSYNLKGKSKEIELHKILIGERQQFLISKKEDSLFKKLSSFLFPKTQLSN